jgi:hypothetical protein
MSSTAANEVRVGLDQPAVTNVGDWLWRLKVAALQLYFAH